ncbi:hypothetical protein BC827DRAFT_1157624 [Russula dissimulans]|nr:hypothetical protein BC827DRAFT_1157624 [Russula dissimulans]
MASYAMKLVMRNDRNLYEPRSTSSRSNQLYYLDTSVRLDALAFPDGPVQTLFFIQGYLLKNKARLRERVNEVTEWYCAVISEREAPARITRQTKRTGEEGKRQQCTIWNTKSPPYGWQPGQREWKFSFLCDRSHLKGTAASGRRSTLKNVIKARRGWRDTAPLCLLYKA